MRLSDVELIKTSSYRHLHGLCVFWLLGHMQHNDDIYICTQHRMYRRGESIYFKECFIHAFLHRDGEYVDAAGATININEILERFNINKYSFGVHLYKVDNTTEMIALLKNL